MNVIDGEAFSQGIRTLGLGQIVGTRTWGGGIWLSSDNVLVDGGLASAPELGTYNDEFGWGLGIENLGVEPDVVVDNDPRKSFDNHDQQLETGIQELIKMMQNKKEAKLPIEPGKKKSVKIRDGVC